MAPRDSPPSAPLPEPSQDAGPIPAGEVVCILPPSDAINLPHDYTVCCLREHTETPEQPFELVLSPRRSIPQDLQRFVVRRFPEHLRRDAGHGVETIVSTGSGTGLAVRFWELVLQPLQTILEASFSKSPPESPPALVTTSPASIRDFAATLTPTPRTIILLTGDGGIVDLLNALPSPLSPAPLIALLPLGTANALFHSLHKHAAAETPPLVAGLRTLVHGAAADLPVFRAEFSGGARTLDGNAVARLDGAIVASYGFHASLVWESDTPEYRVHGAKRFGMVAATLLQESHAYVADVSIRRRDSASFVSLPRKTHAYVLVALASNLERTFAISPASEPLDGRLRLVHFGPVGGQRTMEVMRMAYEGGRHVGLVWEDGERVGYEDVEEVRVVMGEEERRWRMVCVDGTIVEVPKGGEVRVRMVEGVRVRVLVDGDAVMKNENETS